MNYLILQRELETLGKDLAQMAEELIEREPLSEPPPAHPVGHRVKPKEELRREIDYVVAKLEALRDCAQDEGA